MSKNNYDTRNYIYIIKYVYKKYYYKKKRITYIKLNQIPF